jgi:hypothetical protein
LNGKYTASTGCLPLYQTSVEITGNITVNNIKRFCDAIYRLPQTDLHPDGYPRIAGWSLGDQETAAGPETVQTRPRLPGVRPPEREAMRGINGLFHVRFPYIPGMKIGGELK